MCQLSIESDTFKQQTQLPRKHLVDVCVITFVPLQSGHYVFKDLYLSQLSVYWYWPSLHHWFDSFLNYSRRAKNVHLSQEREKHCFGWDCYYKLDSPVFQQLLSYCVLYTWWNQLLLLTVQVAGSSMRIFCSGTIAEPTSIMPPFHPLQIILQAWETSVHVKRVSSHCSTWKIVSCNQRKQ